MKMGGILYEFLYECDDVTVSNNRDNLRFDIAGGKISIKEEEM